MNTYVRTLWGNDDKPLWENRSEREALRWYLNERGFHVITGLGDSLEVYAIEYYKPWDINFLNKSLDKLQKVWYSLSRTKERLNEPK